MFEDDVTIEDDIEIDEDLFSFQTQANSEILPWSFIVEIVTKPWFIFLLATITIGSLLLFIRQRRRDWQQRNPSSICDQDQGRFKTYPKKRN